jgi:hypothetical protein
MPFMPAGRKRWTRALTLVGFVALFLSAGYAVASITISSNPLTANGNFQTNAGLNYWTETTVASSTIPSPVPSGVSTTPGTPTVLAATSGSFALNTAVVGDNAIEFTFTEQTNATANTEVELTFKVGTQTGSTVTVKAYIETQATVPATAKTYSFYYDLGGAAGTTSILISTADQTSQQCASVGSCP